MPNDLNAASRVATYNICRPIIELKAVRLALVSGPDTILNKFNIIMPRCITDINL